MKILKSLGTHIGFIPNFFRQVLRIVLWSQFYQSFAINESAWIGSLLVCLNSVFSIVSPKEAMNLLVSAGGLDKLNYSMLSWIEYYLNFKSQYIQYSY